MVNLPPYFMVFDVESVGLHGEGFAVGWVVVERSGKELDARVIACSPDKAGGNDEGRAWIAANCPPIHQIGMGYWPPKLSGGAGADSPAFLRRLFWGHWLHWKERGAVLVADCAWPVEARFLLACVDDDPQKREWQGPYPLHDLASFRLAAGLDPLETNERLPDELPVHDPLADARQSARLLFEAIQVLKGHSEVLS